MKTILISLLLLTSSYAARYECGYNFTIDVYSNKIVTTLSDGYISVYKRNKYGEYCKYYNIEKDLYTCVKQDGKNFNFITSDDVLFVKCERID